MTVNEPPKPPAGWHSDPNDPQQLRYWDGDKWTEHRSPTSGSTVQGNAAAPHSEKNSGVPWWVWLIIALIVVPGLIFAALVVFAIAADDDT